MRRFLRHKRRHLAALLAVTALAGVVVAHHGAMTAGHLHHDGAMTAAVEMCLGVFTAVGAAVAAVALGVRALGRWRPAGVLEPGTVVAATRLPQRRSRDGPTLLFLLCVSRR